MHEESTISITSGPELVHKAKGLVVGGTHVADTRHLAKCPVSQLEHQVLAEGRATPARQHHFHLPPSAG
jgi:hypothetical protein